jgi:hypothetical protein
MSVDITDRYSNMVYGIRGNNQTKLAENYLAKY